MDSDNNIHIKCIGRDIHALTEDECSWPGVCLRDRGEGVEWEEIRQTNILKYHKSRLLTGKVNAVVNMPPL